MEVRKGQYDRWQKEIEELGCVVNRVGDELHIDNKYVFNLKNRWATVLSTDEKLRSLRQLIGKIKEDKKRLVIEIR